MTAQAKPPIEFTSRVGGRDDEYGAIGKFHREMILELLPEDWVFEGKRVLDFGCGPGRTLQTFQAEANSAKFYGCDIHTESIEWAKEQLSPPFFFFSNDEEPPLAQPSGSFDLIWGISVFTHITDRWTAWLAEMHRLLAPDGLALFTFLGEGVWRELTTRPWDPDKVGMLILRPGAPWSAGGPNVVHSEWWLRAHWGRAFEILSVRPCSSVDPCLGHGWILMRRREQSVTVDEIEALQPAETRETAALQFNIELLCEEATQLRGEIDSLEREVAAAQAAQSAALERQRMLEADQHRLARNLQEILASRSWRFTAGLRRLRQRMLRP